ncbi:MAG TPA: hypothetical protein VIT91_19875 [Chthoniobacterales bacterium]
MENARQTPSLSIGTMSLRVPGHDAAAGNRIAQQTAELLAAGATSASLENRHIAALRLRVQSPAGASEAEIARAVSRAILGRLTPSSDA